MRTYVILGGNGVFGVHLIIYLLRHCPDIFGIAVGRKPEKIRPFSLHLGIDDARYEYHEIHMAFNPERVSDLIRERQAGVVVNFAAHAEVASSWKHPFHYYETNVVALSKILAVLMEADGLRNGSRSEVRRFMVPLFSRQRRMRLFALRLLMPFLKWWRIIICGPCTRLSSFQ